MGSSKAGAWALLDIDISEEIVMKTLKMLRQDKAGGPDELIPRLLIMIHEDRDMLSIDIAVQEIAY